MKAKVTLTDSYSGRSINLICEVDNIAFIGEDDKYIYDPHLISKRQQKKTEDFFGGREAAYHTKAEIVKLMPAENDAYREVLQYAPLFNNWHTFTAYQVAEWVQARFNYSSAIAKKIAYRIKHRTL